MSVSLEAPFQNREKHHNSVLFLPSIIATTTDELSRVMAPLLLNAAFVAAFTASFFAIICSELGDKTFIIAALLSMKHGHFVVFAGAVSALGLMTLLSAVVGYALPAILSREYTHCGATILFFCFGVKLLHDGFKMERNAEHDEIQEVEAELRKKSDADSIELTECTASDPVSPYKLGGPLYVLETQGASSADPGLGDAASAGEFATEFPKVVTEEIGEDKTFAGHHCTEGRRVVERTKGCHHVGKQKSATEVAVAKRRWWSCLRNIAKPAFVQAFTLTFLAEWGDRSQIATIALAASKDPFGVVVGGVLGHAICTGIAVLGGKIIASSISERTVTYAGGFLFLVFAVVGAVWGI